MKHVPVDLIPLLNAGSVSQKPKQIELDISQKTDTIETIYTYDKGHNIPAGFYIVRFLFTKYQNKRFAKLCIEVLADATNGKPFIRSQTITGYIEKELALDHLAKCFNGGQPLRTSKDCKGKVGIIQLSDSGWIDCVNTDYWANNLHCDLTVF